MITGADKPDGLDFGDCDPSDPAIEPAAIAAAAARA